LVIALDVIRQAIAFFARARVRRIGRRRDARERSRGDGSSARAACAERKQKSAPFRVRAAGRDFGLGRGVRRATPIRAHTCLHMNDLSVTLSDCPSRPFGPIPATLSVDGERVTFDRHESFRKLSYPTVVVGNRTGTYCTATCKRPRGDVHFEEFAL